MVEFAGEKQPRSRIQWTDVDLEAAGDRPQATPDPLQRTNSNISIHSMHSRRGSIDPASALPIQYRTISFQIDESKEKDVAEAKKAKDSAAKELGNLDWHIISTNEIYTRLSSSSNQGLSSEQAKRRLTEYGKNTPSPPPTHRFKQIFGYFFRGFGSILLVGSILVFVSWKPLGDPPAVANLALAIVLLAVFFIQAAFNAWQDWSSSRVMASISTMLPDDCLMLRDGTQVTVIASDIVPGDILFIKSGNKLPADVRFVEVSSDAKFDRSILTGESFPLPGTVESSDENYLETKCIGMQGTHCISGSAVGVVVSTGDSTVFGRIAKLTNAPKTGMTPLEKEVVNFVFIICSIMFSMILIVIIVWAAYLRKFHPGWINVPLLIVDCVSVAIAFIPEGLPIALTASLTITANIMRKNKILCKSLKTVETLGSVSVICSDKTGTLTKNKMCVTECSIGLQNMDPQATRDEMMQRRNEGKGFNAVDQLRLIAGLCNSGEFDASTYKLPLHERKINGDATDQAVLRFSESLGPVTELRQMWKKTFELAFNSKNKYMIRTLELAEEKGLEVALHTTEAATFRAIDTLLTIKGAPDVLITRCTKFITPDGDAKPLDENTLREIENIKDKWSSEGKRVILLARKTICREEMRESPTSARYEDEVMHHARSGLTFVGIVGIVDPPRDEIPSVVKILRRAGIRIFMVTGDFALTAQAIAAECGIVTNPPHMVKNISALSRDYAVPTSESGNEKETSEIDHETQTSIVISGPEMITLNENQWDQLCTYTEIVFARTTPEQKLRIVREFQSRSEIVGMTGDGVNDAPSLKAADIGIALGSGSDIAIEAADMVLLESFSAIVEAVQYGRVVFDNLKKTIAYLLPAGSFSEFWPVMTNVIFGIPQVLSSFLMIIICCFTDCAAATVLAYETPEADVLLRRPRRPGTDRLVSWQLILQSYGFIGVLETVSSFAMAFWYLQRNGLPFGMFWFKYGELPEGVDQDFVNQKLVEASSVYFVNLVVMQYFTLLTLRTRRLSLFSHPPIFNKATQNLYIFPAILFSLAMAFFWLYIPKLQSTLGTSSVGVEYWFLPVAFGMGILLLDEGRKYFVRRGWGERWAWSLQYLNFER
ncbi:Calcium ATPase, transmembrane M [Glarea lozoyensis ATCC 20868]|uniref:Calcium ATPase, transmembrane M n=1 Tax=Glarea lozoyensis (strain ATCC 20868 / MF5171) TaxID=1116229 RepID=S3E794_GLAL2|nr:Calcium ATPase, transmembrane M [Glarea lozoyensis ATCC 20868]EPE34198.1 Calcium ATPase, transmembrane M [Glarea lozoyensis ATCC 20868]